MISFKHNFTKFFPVNLHLNYYEKLWQTSFSNSSNSTFIAEVDSKIVGFLSLSGNEISRVYILPDYQRRHIGTQLMKEAKKYLFKEAFVQVYSQDIGAQRFYEKMGGKYSHDSVFNDYNASYRVKVYKFNI